MILAVAAGFQPAPGGGTRSVASVSSPPAGRSGGAGWGHDRA
ncbi:MAG: hypothetical protein QXI19_07110 [Candidatus Caldarchaeum sp.]